MKDQTRNIPDIADRASEETDRALELRTRDRQRKLVSKIDAALPGALPATPWLAVGNVPVVTLLLLVLGLALWPRRRGRAA